MGPFDDNFRMLYWDVIQGDRRLDRRYDVDLESRLTFTDSEGRQESTSGAVTSLSRRAVRLNAETTPPNGARVELRIAWPFLLQKICQLDLLVHGAIYKTGARGTILRIEKYEFQTRGPKSFAEPAVRQHSLRIVA